MRARQEWPNSRREVLRIALRIRYQNKFRKRSVVSNSNVPLRGCGVGAIVILSVAKDLLLAQQQILRRLRLLRMKI